MADVKKTDTASEETGRPDEDAVETGQMPDTEETSDPEGDGREAGHPNDTADDGIEDAEVVEEILSDDTADTLSEEDVLVEDVAIDPVDAPDPDDISDLETLDGVTPEIVTDEPTAPTDDAPEAMADEPDTPPEPVAEVQALKETVIVERKGGFVPGFVGGLIAATGVFFAAPYVIPGHLLPANKQLNADLGAQAESIQALEAQIAAMGGRIDDTTGKIDSVSTNIDTVSSNTETSVTELKTGVAGLQTAVTDMRSKFATSAAMEDALAAMTETNKAIGVRVTDLEKRPIAEATDPASIAAVEAYAREMAELRAEVAEQIQQSKDLAASTSAAAQEAVQKAIDASDTAVADAEAASKAAQEMAATEAAEAAAKALRAQRAQALVDIQAALETGGGFAEVLPELDGIDVPETLTAVAADGVATLPDLRDAYVIAARDALAAARKETAGGSMSGRFGAFMQNQLGVRSLAPSEGDDPDAVLSRAEAATREARLTDAVSELAALPDGGRLIMADWMALATTRAEALAAADELAASLAAN